MADYGSKTNVKRRRLAFKRKKAAMTAAVRNVATPEGVKHFGQPLGSVIVPDAKITKVKVDPPVGKSYSSDIQWKDEPAIEVKADGKTIGYLQKGKLVEHEMSGSVRSGRTFTVASGYFLIGDQHGRPVVMRAPMWDPKTPERQWHGSRYGQVFSKQGDAIEALKQEYNWKIKQAKARLPGPGKEQAERDRLEKLKAQPKRTAVQENNLNNAARQTLKDRGFKYNSTYQRWEAPNGLAVQQTAGGHASVHPPGKSMWSTDRSGITNHDSLWEAVDSLDDMDGLSEKAEPEADWTDKNEGDRVGPPKKPSSPELPPLALTGPERKKLVDEGWMLTDTGVPYWESKGWSREAALEASKARGDLEKIRAHSDKQMEKALGKAKFATGMQRHLGEVNTGAQGKDPERFQPKRTLADGHMPEKGMKVVHKDGRTGAIEETYQTSAAIRWDDGSKAKTVTYQKLNETSAGWSGRVEAATGQPPPISKEESDATWDKIDKGLSAESLDEGLLNWLNSDFFTKGGTDRVKKMIAAGELPADQKAIMDWLNEKGHWQGIVRRKAFLGRETGEVIRGVDPKERDLLHQVYRRITSDQTPFFEDLEAAFPDMDKKTLRGIISRLVKENLVVRDQIDDYNPETGRSKKNTVFQAWAGMDETDAEYEAAFYEKLGTPEEAAATRKAADDYVMDRKKAHWDEGDFWFTKPEDVRDNMTTDQVQSLYRKLLKDDEDIMSGDITDNVDDKLRAAVIKRLGLKRADAFPNEGKKPESEGGLTLVEFNHLMDPNFYGESGRRTVLESWGTDRLKQVRDELHKRQQRQEDGNRARQIRELRDIVGEVLARKTAKESGTAQPRQRWTMDSALDWMDEKGLKKGTRVQDAKGRVGTVVSLRLSNGEPKIAETVNEPFVVVALDEPTEINGKTVTTAGLVNLEVLEDQTKPPMRVPESAITYLRGEEEVSPGDRVWVISNGSGPSFNMEWDAEPGTVVEMDPSDRGRGTLAVQIDGNGVLENDYWHFATHAGGLKPPTVARDKIEDERRRREGKA